MVLGKGHSSNPARRQFWINLCITVASILISLSILELGSFIYFSKIKSYTSLEMARRYEYDPYRGYRLMPGYQRDGAQHNSQGFRRTEEVSREKPAGTYRIFLMGGSTAYGMSAGGVFPSYRISNNETIDHYLERFLNQSSLGRRFEVINAAVSGYWTHHHFIYLNQELLDYDPDIVIFLDGHNDHYILDKNHKQFEVNYRTEQIEALNNSTLLGVLEHLLSYAATKSWFGLGLMSGVDKIRSWNRVKIHKDKLAGNINDYEEIARRTFLKMIKRNVLILKEEGVVPVVLLQPELALFQEKQFTPEENKLLKIELSYRQEGYQERLNILNKKAVRLIRQLAEKYKFLFLDLRNVFKDMKSQAYIDYVHLSPAGARRLAEYVGKRIFPLIQAGLHPRKTVNLDLKGAVQ